MGLKVMDAVFGGVAAMDIQRNKLESGTPVLCDDAEVFLAGLVVKEFVINGVIALLDFFMMRLYAIMRWRSWRDWKG